MKLKKIAALIAITGLSTSAFATNGYFAHGIGIKAKAMGGAGIAYAEDGMGMATNPATLSQAPASFTLGASLFVPDRKMTAVVGGGWTGQDFSGNSDSNFIIPEAAYVARGSKGISYGVVAYGNGGMNTNYGKSVYDSDLAPGTVGTNRKTMSNLEQLFIAPTVAMKLNDQHTLALSLNLVRQTLKIEGVGAFSGFTSGPGVTDPGNHGTAVSTGVGVRLGWTGQMTKDFSVGAFYQPKTGMGKFSAYKNLLAEQGGFDIPETYGLGMALAVTPATTVLFDVVEIGYKGIKSLSNPNNNNNANTTLGANDGKGFGWKDMTVYKLGLRHQLNDKMILRAGYNYGEQPIPRTELDFNLLAPAVVEHHLTLGFTYKLDKSSEISAHYMQAFEKKVTGTGTLGSQSMSAAKMSQTEFGVQYMWKF